jgi:hypothetical protein
MCRPRFGKTAKYLCNCECWMKFPQFSAQADVQGRIIPPVNGQGKGLQVVRLREIVMILELKRQGLGVSAISRQTGLDRKMVRKYLDRGLEVLIYGPREPGARLAERFQSYLSDRLEAFPGLSARRLHREIKAMGDEGAYSTLTEYLRLSVWSKVTPVPRERRQRAAAPRPARQAPHVHRNSTRAAPSRAQL